MNDEDVRIEVAQDLPKIVEKTERAIQGDFEIASPHEASESPGAAATIDDAQANDGESVYAVSVEPSDPKRISTPQRSSTAAQRRTKLHPWMRNPNVMLGTAIVVGGIAAILVGNLVLWLLKPAPKPPRSRYAAVHHNIELHRPSTSSGHDAFRRS